jgi:lipid A disaccharide synthetase
MPLIALFLCGIRGLFPLVAFLSTAVRFFGNVLVWPAPQMKKRQATLRRETGETKIAATLELDGSGRSEIHTVVALFDHILRSVSMTATTANRSRAPVQNSRASWRRRWSMALRPSTPPTHPERAHCERRSIR